MSTSQRLPGLPVVGWTDPITHHAIPRAWCPIHAPQVLADRRPVTLIEAKKSGARCCKCDEPLAHASERVR